MNFIINWITQIFRRNNLVNWINQTFHRNFTPQDIDAARDFTLLWNVLEGVVFNANFNIASAERLFQQRQFDERPFLPFYIYFRNRYINANGVVNQRFTALHFRGGDRQGFVEQTLIDQTSQPREKVLAIMIIVYRLRNNLFHGIKEIPSLDQQRTNFENANQFLMTLLSYYV